MDWGLGKLASDGADGNGAVLHFEAMVAAVSRAAMGIARGHGCAGVTCSSRIVPLVDIGDEVR